VALVAAELQLELAEFSVHISTLTHIPGISNVLPDALSRLWAPEISEIPAELQSVTRTPVPLRDTEFWRSAHVQASPSSPDGPLLTEGRARNLHTVPPGSPLLTEG